MKKFTLILIAAALILTAASCKKNYYEGGGGGGGGGGNKRPSVTTTQQNTDETGMDSTDITPDSLPTDATGVPDIDYTPNEETAQLTGKWKTVIDMSHEINSEMGLEDGTVTGFKFDYIVEFNQNGTYNMYATQDSIRAAVAAVRPMMEEKLREMYEGMAEELGKTLQEVLEMAEAESIQQIIDRSLGESYVEGLSESFSNSGRYLVKQNKLYQSASMTADFDESVYIEIEFSADKLIYKRTYSENGQYSSFTDLNAVLPIEFNRVS